MLVTTSEIEGKDPKTAPKMELSLVTSTQDKTWPLGTWGILGLSPVGAFFNYLKTMYDESPMISISVKFHAWDQRLKSEDLSFRAQVYLNMLWKEHFEMDDVVGSYQQEQGTEYWYVPGGVRLDGSEFAYKDQKMCLDTYTTDYIGVIEGSIWCNRARAAACDLEKHPKCLAANADLTKAPSVFIMLDKTEIELKADEYAYFTNEGMQCRFGDPCTARGQGTCGQETEVVLGKLFMEKYIPILSWERTKDAFFVSLTKKFRSPDERNAVWLILGILAAIIVVFAVIYIIMKRKQKNEEAHYILHDEEIN